MLLLRNIFFRKKNKKSGTSDDSACVSLVALALLIVNY